MTKLPSLACLALLWAPSAAFAPLRPSLAVFPAATPVEGRRARAGAVYSEPYESTGTATPGSIFEDPPRFTNPETAVFEERSYFYGMVKVDIGEGFKPMTETFAPSYSDDECALAVVEVPLPLGMIIEESANIRGRTQVGEVNEDSNAAKAGIKEGDIIRAVSAQQRDTMGAAESNIAYNAVAGASMAGMKVKILRALFIADNQPFDAVMEAITSNVQSSGGRGRVAMVLERRNQKKAEEKQ